VIGRGEIAEQVLPAQRRFGQLLSPTREEARIVGARDIRALTDQVTRDL